MAGNGAFRTAKRLDEVGFSDIVQIRNKVLEMRSAGMKVHAFHGGEPGPTHQSWMPSRCRR